MSKLVVLVLLLALLGCAKRLAITIDGRAAQYVQEFEQRYNIKVAYDVVFVPNMGGTRIGICSAGPYYRKIELNEAVWNTLSVWRRHQLVFHELAHCSFELEHDNTMLDGRRKSLMSSTAIPSEIYRLYINQYLADLDQKIAQRRLK